MKKTVTAQNQHVQPGIARTQRGVAMLESLIALLIFSMGIIALVGLQAAMLKNTSDAKYRAEATFIAQQKLGEIWLNTKAFDALSGYVVNNEDVSSYLPNGKRTVEVASAPECTLTVTVTWQSPGEEMHSYSANARTNSMLEQNPPSCIYK